MSVSSGPQPQHRGTERLLRDCALFGRMLDGGRTPARRRLERQLGEEFARRLVYGLRRRAQLDNGV